MSRLLTHRLQIARLSPAIQSGWSSKELSHNFLVICTLHWLRVRCPPWPSSVRRNLCFFFSFGSRRRPRSYSYCYCFFSLSPLRTGFRLSVRGATVNPSYCGSEQTVQLGESMRRNPTEDEMAAASEACRDPGPMLDAGPQGPAADSGAGEPLPEDIPESKPQHKRTPSEEDRVSPLSQG